MNFYIPTFTDISIQMVLAAITFCFPADVTVFNI